MEDSQLSETEAAERIQTSQLQGNIYKARQAQREKAITALSSDLANVIRQSHNELQGLVSGEVARREDIIRARVIDALQVGKAVDPRRMGPELADLMYFCGPVQEIRALGPSPVIPAAGNNEILVQAAKDVLTKFEKVIAEAAKTI
jgi:hypothetical protein